MPLFNTFYDASPWVFLLCTIVLGGAAAFVTGKAIAETWRPFWQVIAYLMCLGLVVRFIQFALFQERLLSARNYLVDIAVLIACGVVGYLIARRRQMATQYGWSATKHG
jgi:drug/metabolite transporter (DMT)-like permease